MTVSTHHLPPLAGKPLRVTRQDRPGIRDWIAALAWTSALTGAHLLLFLTVIVFLALR